MITGTGETNQVSIEAKENQNTPELDRSGIGLENTCVIISDPYKAKNEGTTVKLRAKHSDANDNRELDSIENFDSEAVQGDVEEEIVKIGAKLLHSDVKSEETKIIVSDDENKRVNDEDIIETQNEIVADDENAIDKGYAVIVTNSDDANEDTNAIDDVVQSDEGTQSDVDEVCEEKEIIDNNIVESSGTFGEATDEENNTVELTGCADMPNADNMLTSEDFVNDNIAYSKNIDSVVNMENNNIYTNNTRDLNRDLKSDLNEDRVFLPRRRSSSTQKLGGNDLGEEHEGYLDSDLEKNTFRSPLSSVDQLIEMLASQTEREKRPEKTESESSDTQSDLEKSPMKDKCEKDSCENLTKEHNNLGAPEKIVPENSVENQDESSLGSPEELVKPENNEFIDSLYEPPCLKNDGNKSDEQKVSLETQNSNLNEIESDDKSHEEASLESSEVVEHETEEKLLQSLNKLHDNIKSFTNSLKEKGKSIKLENRADESERRPSSTESPGGDQPREPDVNSISEVKEERGNDFIDSLYEPANLKEVQNEPKSGFLIKDIPQMVNQPVFFDSNYEEVTENKSENGADQSEVEVAPSAGGFFLSDLEQSETVYTESPEGTQVLPRGERGEITVTWAEFPNRTPRIGQNSPHFRGSDDTSNRDPVSNASDPPKSENTFEFTASTGKPGRSPSFSDSRVNPISTLEAADNVKSGITKVDEEQFEGRESNNLHNLSSDSLEDLTLIEPLDKSSDIIETSSVRSDISQDSLCDDDVNNNDNDDSVEDNLKNFSDKVSPIAVETNSKGTISKGHLMKASKAQCDAVRKGHPDMNETLSSFTDDSIEMEEVEGATSSQLSSTLFETDTTPTFPKQPCFHWPVDNRKSTNNTFSRSDSKPQNSMFSARRRTDSSVEQHGATNSTKSQVENSGDDTFDFHRMKESLQQESFYLNNNNNSGSGPRDKDPRLVAETLVYRRPLVVEEGCESDSLSSDSLADDDDLSEGEIQILTEYGDKSLKVPPRDADHLESIEEEGQGQELQGHRGRKCQRRSRLHNQQRSRSELCDGAALSFCYEEDATAL